MISDIYKELSDAWWATRRAAKYALGSFCKRWPYLWNQRERRQTIDLVESWYEYPDQAP